MFKTHEQTVWIVLFFYHENNTNHKDNKFYIQLLMQFFHTIIQIWEFSSITYSKALSMIWHNLDHSRRNCNLRLLHRNDGTKPRDLNTLAYTCSFLSSRLLHFCLVPNNFTFGTLLSEPRWC